MNLVKYYWNKKNRKYSGVIAAGVLGVYTEPLYLLLFLLFQMVRGPVFKSKVSLLFLVLVLHGFSMSLFTGYNINKFLQQLVLIVIVLYGYIQLYKSSKKSVDYWFGMYMGFSYIVSILGLFQLFMKLAVDINVFPYTLDLRPTQNSERVHSVLIEAGHLALFLTPAVSYIIISRFFYGINKIKSLVILSAAILTFSSSMYIGIGIAIMIKLYKKLRKLRLSFMLFGVFLAFSLFSVDYNNSEYQESTGVKNAYQKILQSAEALKFLMSSDSSPSYFENFNLSTYTTMTNAWVALNAPYRITGTGLGTHQQNYEAMYDSDYIYYGFNKEDGYSLFTRMFSEFGLIGIVLYLCFLIKFFNKRNILSYCLLIFIISALIKGGLYSLNCSVLFQYLYYQCSKKSIDESFLLNCLNPNNYVKTYINNNRNL